ncbi:phage tail protein [Methylobacterium sp. BTF04]|uniref:phage tail protein n=1 Tax=Methylobacterium sp. BTF04 TaxID=2708300 RepID=UPI001FEE58A5|nr:phage tail protein [Methylobacterium sp. BTF04]
MKILKAEFGDGYSQSAGDGMNHIRKVFDLKWDPLTDGQAATIEVFLERHGSTKPFLYQHPRASTPIKVTSEEWERTDNAASLCGFRAVLLQSFVLV